MKIRKTHVMLIALFAVGFSAVYVSAQQQRPNPADIRVNTNFFRVKDQLRVDDTIYCDRRIQTDTVFYKNLQKISSRDSKKDIEQVDPATAYEVLRTLDTVQYRYRDEDENEKMTYGFIAEDVDSRINGKNSKTISTDHIVAFMASVIRDQNRRIKALELRLNSAESP